MCVRTCVGECWCVWARVCLRVSACVSVKVQVSARAVTLAFACHVPPCTARSCERSEAQAAIAARLLLKHGAS